MSRERPSHVPRHLQLKTKSWVLVVTAMVLYLNTSVLYIWRQTVQTQFLQRYAPNSLHLCFTPSTLEPEL
jgi:hypothetical protein